MCLKKTKIYFISSRKNGDLCDDFSFFLLANLPLLLHIVVYFVVRTGEYATFRTRERECEKEEKETHSLRS